jgi:hypothetical protein
MKNFKLFFHLCLSSCFLLSANAGASNWSYSKPSVIEYFSDWRDQVSTDAYLSERERDLRLELIDRLNFQVDRKYVDEDLRGFLERITWDMALTDEMAQNKVWSSGGPEFLKNLHLCLREVLEPAENILGFVRSYVEFTTLSTPKSVEDFASSRSYTNGSEIESAAPLSLEDAGTVAEDPTALPAPMFLDSKIPETRTETTPDQNQNPSPPQKADEHLIL